ncbi:MAG: DUF4153 domain-containing protein [Patescibacteria group bacterium]|nr:DUF4153 domain-containing protein [Patescibacteria group bacterium]
MKFSKRIKNNLSNPKELESFYREDKDQFIKAFSSVFSENPENLLLQAWSERLNFKNVQKTEKVNQKLVYLTVFLGILAGLAARTLFVYVDDGNVNPGNFSFVIFPLLMIYFFVHSNIKKKTIWYSLVAVAAIAGYFNTLPIENSHSSFLATIHLPFLLWGFLAIAYLGKELSSYRKRIEFIKYNGEMLLLAFFILFLGVIMTFLTIALFSAIKIDVFEFYAENIVIAGIAASPIVATYLATSFKKNIVKSVIPYLAKIFSPLVLITLIIYLFFLIEQGVSPFFERDTLIVFNAMLIAVLVLVIFVIAERAEDIHRSFNDYVTIALISVVIIINIVALSAIGFRLSSYGVTPNRIAVLGINLLVFFHLIKIGFDYFRFIANRTKLATAEKTIVGYLPIYVAWTAIVVFLFPVIFSFE